MSSQRENSKRGGALVADTFHNRHYLLAAGGFNPDEALKNLEAFDAQAAYEPSTIPIDTDIDVSRSRRDYSSRITANDHESFSPTSDHEKSKTSCPP